MKSSQAGQPRNEALRDFTNTILENQTHKRLTEAVSFPPSPFSLPESDECSSEKLYISLLKREREKDRQVENVGFTDRKKEKKERNLERYKNLNGVIAESENIRRKNRGKYKVTSVKGRCRQFAQDFYDLGFPFGFKISKRELRYRMITLGLCHDRITIKQYFERLVMFGYFKILPNGMYEFRSTLPVGQQALPDPKTTMHRLHASLNPIKRTLRSY